MPRELFELGPGGRNEVSTTNLPSGPLRITTLPRAESIVTLSASFCVCMGTALNLARILASRSAAKALLRIAH